MSHQIFNEKSYAILRQKYNPVKIKTDIGGEKKNEEGRGKMKLKMKYNMHTARKGM